MDEYYLVRDDDKRKGYLSVADPLWVSMFVWPGRGGKIPSIATKLSKKRAETLQKAWPDTRLEKIAGGKP